MYLLVHLTSVNWPHSPNTDVPQASLPVFHQLGFSRQNRRKMTLNLSYGQFDHCRKSPVRFLATLVSMEMSKCAKLFESCLHASGALSFLLFFFKNSLSV